MVKEHLGHNEEIVIVLKTPKKKVVFSNKKRGGISKILRRIRECLK